MKRGASPPRRGPRAAPASFLRRLPPEARTAVESAVGLAAASGTALYAAGGAVRDLLLGRPVRDVDLVVEGNALRFARDLARDLGSRERAHPSFGTASIPLPGRAGLLDVAGARREVYAHAGALPRVRPASIEEDLARRDFSINALALRLWPKPRRILDPQGGRADLARGSLRLLHSRSAVDDPTRAWRAVRYAARLGFRLEPRSSRWIREAAVAGAFDRVSGDRVRRELEKLLSEPGRSKAVALATRLGIARTVHPGLQADRGTLARLARAEALVTRAGQEGSWLSWLLVWAAEFDATASQALARRLNLPRRQARILSRWPERRRALQRGAPLTPPAAPEELFAAAGMHGRALMTAPALRIRGRDLIAAGLAPGPAIGRALGETRSARLSGRIRPEQELAFALESARRESP